jgi:fucose 4-O-acetylase-like acetyltransferase
MYGNGHYLDWVQLWFLPHLFAVSLFAWFFIQVVRRTRLFRVRWVILAMIYVAGVLGIALFWPFGFNLLGKEYTVFGLPYSLDIVFVSGFFFILGYELNKEPRTSLFENPLSLFISGLILILLVWFLPPTIDFNTRLFESLPINTTEALLGILFVLAIAKQMERVGWLSSLFRYMGQASLIILIFQVPIQDYWGQKILVLTNNLPFSYWISFLAGVIGPIVINALFIRPNPIMRKWFSQSGPQDIEPVTASVFE